jgi:hypothetical protein
VTPAWSWQRAPRPNRAAGAARASTIERLRSPVMASRRLQETAQQRHERRDHARAAMTERLRSRAAPRADAM